MKCRCEALWKSGLWIACVSASLLRTEAAPADADSALRAKAFNVISATLQTDREISTFNLQVSFDGETYLEANVGLPRPWRLFYSINQTEGEATITVPVVGVLSGGHERFLFREPGQKWFRWRVEYKDGSEPSNIEQEVLVGDPSGADLDFIAGLGAPDLMRAMGGKDFFERQTGNAIGHLADPEVRAVAVIGRLLYMTREAWVGDAVRVAGPKGDTQKAAGILLSLAKEIPESSYAPYAAYYAGSCHAAMGMKRVIETVRAKRVPGQRKEKVAESEYMAALTQKDPDCVKALAAFRLAAERGDDYLKPRALYQEARLRATGGALDEAHKLLDEALGVGGADGTIGKLVGELAREIGRLKELRSQPKRDDDE